MFGVVLPSVDNVEGEDSIDSGNIELLIFFSKLHRAYLSDCNFFFADEMTVLVDYEQFKGLG